MQPRRWSSLIPQFPVWSHTLTQGRTGCWLSPHFSKTILQAGVTKRSRTPFLHLTPTYRQKRSPRHSKPRIQVPDGPHPSSLINSRFQMGNSEPQGLLCHPPCWSLWEKQATVFRPNSLWWYGGLTRGRGTLQEQGTAQLCWKELILLGTEHGKPHP